MSSKSSNRLAAMMREPVTVAIVVAVLITGLLAFAILAIWSGGPEPNPRLLAPAHEQAALTPTPRAIHWPRSTPPAAPSQSSVRRSSSAVANVPWISAAPSASTPAAIPRPTRTPPPEPTGTPTPTPTPAPRPSPTRAPTATPAPTPEPEFEADDAASFSQMAGGRWYVSGNQFVFDAPQATSEPWLLAPYQTPAGDFAIEAEIRVDGLGQGYCNQSFGLVAGSQQLGQFWGGGFIYGCTSNEPLARITDVSNWADGYDRDRVLASENFDPERGWRRLRLEVRGNDFRLLIDGDEVLTASDDQLPARLNSGQGGLWTQGVLLTVRRLAIYELE